VYEIITGSAARYNFGAHYNIAAHCSFGSQPELSYYERNMKRYPHKIALQRGLAPK